MENIRGRIRRWFLNDLVLDLRQGLRHLTKTPLTTLVIVATLAVAIALTTLSVSIAGEIGFPGLLASLAARHRGRGRELERRLG